MVVVAAPSYLKQRGTPRTPQDLAQHNMLGFCFSKQIDGWPFLGGEGGDATTLPIGNALVSDGEAMRQLTVAGAGLARLTRFHVDHDIAAGKLVPVLEEFNPGDLEAIHAVFVGHGGQLPARVRAFLDYLVETVKL
jgi:DNA-binding transcriptional LysR family regulator